MCPNKDGHTVELYLILTVFWCFRRWHNQSWAFIRGWRRTWRSRKRRNVKLSTCGRVNGQRNKKCLYKCLTVLRHFSWRMVCRQQLWHFAIRYSRKEYIVYSWNCHQWRLQDLPVGWCRPRHPSPQTNVHMSLWDAWWGQILNWGQRHPWATSACHLPVC